MGVCGSCKDREHVIESNMYDARPKGEHLVKGSREKYHPLIEDYVRRHPFDDVRTFVSHTM